MKDPQAALEEHLQAIEELVCKLVGSSDYWHESCQYWKDAYYDVLDGIVPDDEPSVGDS